MKIEEVGSVRVDLLGGTLDIPPINLVIPEVVTLNLATELKAYVTINTIEEKKIIFNSIDYNLKQSFGLIDFTPENYQSDLFGKLNFLARIVGTFPLTTGMEIELKSDSPTGAGLGGSSAMGVVLYRALSKVFNLPIERMRSIKVVNEIESIILNSGPAGYQDYFPAMYGGILSLHPTPGEVRVMQHFSPELKQKLETNMSLIYSGETRLSGINNWEVFKGFFDKNDEIIIGLNKIASLSNKAFQSILNKNYTELIDLIAEEGKERAKLFPNILSDKMKSFYSEVREKYPGTGLKVCGAGGGGCFLLIHLPEHKESIEKIVNSFDMKILDFKIALPLK
ncbi:MAG: hypothetical protein HOJ35_07470 [Bdellovibrionales bacterium]|jgi:D-glycero-alpha-D-manno-heptose-7-phosphate kinase|nr:hypothetical protein [Bdellovibrionales bacterium]